MLMLILDVKNRQLIALLITSRSGPSDVRLTDIKLKPKHFVDSTNLLPMSLFTSSSRSTAYFLAIFFPLGGLVSLYNHGALAAISERNIAKDTNNAEFSWGMVRIGADLFSCTSTVDPIVASASKRT